MLNYKSEDGYFDITEEKTNGIITVTTVFSTPIFGIEDFYTIRTFNRIGMLLHYKNALGDEIDYSEQPVKQLIPPRLSEK